MPTLILPLADAKLMAAALVPHTSNDAVFEALANVCVGQSDSQFAVASDRYTVGRYDLTNVATQYPTDVMLIPRELLSAVLSIGPKTLPHDPHRYEVHIMVHPNPEVPKHWEAVLSIHYVLPEKDGMPARDYLHYQRVFAASDQTKAFPPVARLFDQWLPAKGDNALNPFIIAPEYMARFTTYARRTGVKMRVTIPGHDDPARRAQPILVEAGARFKGLIQPFMFTMNEAAEFGTNLAKVNVERDEAEAAQRSQDTDSPETPDDTVPSGS